MLHTIKTARHQAKFSRNACAWLLIDDVGIEQWLAEHLADEQLSFLGLSLNWLIDDAEEALAKRRFTPGEDGSSTIVPLLVCSDDMDLGCTVLVAEQVVEGGTLSWVRFGWSISEGLEVGAQTRWISSSQPVVFALENFQRAVEDFAAMLAGYP
ncbi:hypothetical protein CCOS865_04133 [Pseudomonas reidholzensis]|uniref:Ypar31 protein n=1 Tax=Pseudomonas reidholzensis TaxID=1785162 RepID=A0A383RYL4_9PSED|nr:hypothetical protein [Pseudomonas reidholzensis]SYX91853.1 hypothetical protein CCOS865_04133 [Pseudomonas reidholzensis]